MRIPAAPPVTIREVSAHLLVAFFSLLLFIVGYGPEWVRLGIPPWMQYDSLHHLAVAKAMVQNGWYWHIPWLSAPFTFPMVNFPLGGTFDYLLMFIMSLFVKSPGKLVLFFFILSICLSTLSAMYCLRRLQVSHATSATMAILFAFATNVFWRSNSHLMMTIYLIPFCILFCIQLMTNSVESMTRRDKIVAALSAILIGLNYIYSSFFACFFVAVAGFFALIRYRKTKTVLPAAAYIALVLIFTGLSLLPFLLSIRGDDIALAQLGVKSVAETELYGLKLRHLFMPSPESLIPSLRRLASELPPLFTLETENQSARLGPIGSFGFVAILVAGFAAALPGRAGREPAAPQLAFYAGPLMILIVSAVLLATIGGFGSLFNYFVSPEIRAYNRISPFIFFASLVFAALCVDAAARWMPKALWLALVAAVLVVGLAEQAEFGRLKRTRDAGVAHLATVLPAVMAAQQQLPAGASIYQMPYVPYPHTPPVRGMVELEQLLPPLLSRGLRWSWPALSGKAIRLQEHLATLSGNALAEALVATGYDAVWLNRTAYQDRGAAIIDQLSQAGATLAFDDADYAVLTLSALQARLKSEWGAQEWSRRQRRMLEPFLVSAGETVAFTAQGRGQVLVGSGWAPQEGQARWTDGPRAVLHLNVDNPRREPLDLMIEADAFLIPLRPEVTAEVLVAGMDKGSFRFTTTSPTQRLRIALEGPAGPIEGEIRVELLVDDTRSPMQLGIGEDRRRIGLYVRSLSVVRRGM